MFRFSVFSWNRNEIGGITPTQLSVSITWCTLCGVDEMKLSVADNILSSVRPGRVTPGNYRRNPPRVVDVRSSYRGRHILGLR